MEKASEKDCDGIIKDAAFPEKGVRGKNERERERLRGYKKWGWERKIERMRERKYVYVFEGETSK
jgi:hypothetical protein